jgi:hypothetical protein
MANAIYGRTSPYYTTDIFRKTFLDFMNNRSIPKLDDDVYFQISGVYEYRPDLLAYDLYTDSRLWWVFASRNPNTLKDPLFDFANGVRIYVPKLTTLQQALGI